MWAVGGDSAGGETDLEIDALSAVHVVARGHHNVLRHITAQRTQAAARLYGGQKCLPLAICQLCNRFNLCGGGWGCSSPVTRGGAPHQLGVVAGLPQPQQHPEHVDVVRCHVASCLQGLHLNRYDHDGHIVKYMRNPNIIGFPHKQA